MRITRGTVVRGHIEVDDESLSEGSAVTILVPDEHNFTLSPQDEASILEAIAEAERGEVLDAEEVLETLP